MRKSRKRVLVFHITCAITRSRTHAHIVDAETVSQDESIIVPWNWDSCILVPISWPAVAFSQSLIGWSSFCLLVENSPSGWKCRSILQKRGNRDGLDRWHHKPFFFLGYSYVANCWKWPHPSGAALKRWMFLVNLLLNTKLAPTKKNPHKTIMQWNTLSCSRHMWSINLLINFHRSSGPRLISGEQLKREGRKRRWEGWSAS